MGCYRNAIAAGAQPGTLKVVEIEEYPMPYMQTEAVELRVRVVGDLSMVIAKEST